ncbi:uncharacterized protein LOC128864104 [Anastrepha ludens]|uniref:uncharacterized protein LOC128864104 n=1 Tax=Anastrepha ludens TaxID=28586 RepID=UPI0023B15788|nr:uncharacterized protein LOC128864104 [Anastrepha ludens]
MSRLRSAAKMLIQRHSLPSVVTRLARIISTSAPEPHFGSRRMSIPAEPARFTTKQQLPSEPNVVMDTINPNKSNDKSNNSDGSANVSKPSSKDSKLPDITIVDINGGYKHMDFEQRMEHMDRADNVNNEEVASDITSKLILPLERKMSNVVDIDGFGDDMMYEDKSTTESLPQPTEAAGKEVPGASGVDGSSANSDQQLADTSATLQDKPMLAHDVQAVALENSDNGGKIASVASKNAINAGEVFAGQATDSCTSSGIENICEAPVDIDAFANEEDKLQGTVDIDAYGDSQRMQLPPIPKERNNIFEFKGIKIIMPKRMLRDATYRYRLDPKDKDKPDDIRICVFEK